jgi:hypothetical protein
MFPTIMDQSHRASRAGTGLDLARPQDRGSVVAGPRPLDNSVPPNAFITVLPDVDRGDRRARLAAARQRLQAACNVLPALKAGDPPPAEATLVAALDELASLGIAPGGDPGRAPDTPTLMALRAAALAQLAKSNAAPDDPVALFGEGFPVVALAAAPFPAVVNAALAVDPVAAAPPALLAPLGGKDQALLSWLETTGRVRTSVGRFADLLLAARLRGTGSPTSLRAMQLPVEPFPTAPTGQRSQWVGLRFPAALAADPVTSFVLHMVGTVNAVRPC